MSQLLIKNILHLLLTFRQLFKIFHMDALFLYVVLLE